MNKNNCLAILQKSARITGAYDYNQFTSNYLARNYFNKKRHN